MTVQPRERRVSIAASPVDDGAEPPDWSNTLVPVAIPDATRETRIPSMLASFRLVLSNVPIKLLPFTLSKTSDGKLISELQYCQHFSKLVPLEVSIKGKLVSELQLRHALKNLVTLEVSIKGKLVNEVQLNHEFKRSVALDVSIKGKLVNEVQSRHALSKLVPLDVSINGKLVNEVQLRHA